MLRPSSLSLLEAETPLTGLKTIPAETVGIAESNAISTGLLSS